MNTPSSIQEKISQMVEAWGDLAPDKTFGGMSLEAFQARVKPSTDARATLSAAINAKIDAQTARDASDAESLLAIRQAVNGIKADPTEGENSALYEACGYVPLSKRKSGLTRKAQTAAVPQS